MTTGPTLELRSEITPIRRLLGDVWRNRNLVPLLARQHFQGKHRAARLGVAWSAIQPLLRAGVLAIVFTQVVPIDTDVPYVAFIFAGQAAFSYMAEVLATGATSITGGSDLATRVYFPRLLLTSMAPASQLPPYIISLVVVIGLSWLYGLPPTWTLLALPAAIALSFVLLTAATAILGLLHVYVRDVGPLVGALTGILFYATPVVYPAELVPEGLRFILYLNPLSGAVAAVRWCLFAGEEQATNAVLATVAWTVLLVVAALVAFRRYERICVDRL